MRLNVSVEPWRHFGGTLELRWKLDNGCGKSISNIDFVLQDDMESVFDVIWDSAKRLLLEEYKKQKRTE